MVLPFENQSTNESCSAIIASAALTPLCSSVTRLTSISSLAESILLASIRLGPAVAFLIVCRTLRLGHSYHRASILDLSGLLRPTLPPVKAVSDTGRSPRIARDVVRSTKRLGFRDNVVAMFGFGCVIFCLSLCWQFESRDKVGIVCLRHVRL